MIIDHLFVQTFSSAKKILTPKNVKIMNNLPRIIEKYYFSLVNNSEYLTISFAAVAAYDDMANIFMKLMFFPVRLKFRANVFDFSKPEYKLDLSHLTSISMKLLVRNIEILV